MENRLESWAVVGLRWVLRMPRSVDLVWGPLEKHQS